jgi:eukaryotic-like serine/threonine-protein kinase
MNERDVFIAALEKNDPTKRQVYLDDVCRGDPALRRGVEALLELHEQAGSFLERPSPALAVTVDNPLREAPGTTIGPYKLLEQIGEGGFGVVFMAEQVRPISRRVALKVLKPGMDTRQVVARFEAERQALALMDHPHIARVFDGGETASGRPYFVMELVRGIPITDFCDQDQLSVRQRLELFVDVCRAVQHAHQKGIIHRDLKPSNVLVTLHDGTPVAKVIDFGVAKATGQRLTEKTMFTNFAQMLGTPLYMSPEQAALSGLDVDTRSDVYSLGVLLYELLTGTTPFDKERLATVSYDELRRIIREEEPPKPSTRISTLGQAATTLSTQRKSDPRHLSQLFRGELDWIVMKCLEKDRNRRYDTANSLAKDIEHYLHDEPVQACPPSAAYRLRKFVRRNRAAVVAVVSTMLALAVGLVLMAWQWRVAEDRRQQAERAEAEARKSAAQLKAVNDFFFGNLLGQVSPYANPVGAKFTMRELLDKAAHTIEKNKTVVEQPEVEATIRDYLGSIYIDLALFDEAQPHLARSVEIRRRVLGEKHPDTLEVTTMLVSNAFFRGRLDEAEKLGRQNLADLRERPGDEVMVYAMTTVGEVTLYAMSMLGVTLQTEGKLDEAEALFREAYEAGRQAKEQNLETIRPGHFLAGLLYERGRLDEAEILIKENFEASRRFHGSDDHPEALIGRMWEPVLLQARGKWAEAERKYRDIEKVNRRVLGAEHLDTLAIMGKLGILLHARGKWTEAEPLLRDTVRLVRKVQPNHLFVAWALYAWSDLLLDKGEFKQAEPELREALKIQRQSLIRDHYSTGQTLAALGWVLTKTGRAKEGEPLLREGFDICRKQLPQGDWFTADTESMLGVCLAAQRQYEKAEPLLLNGYKGLREAAGAPPVTDSWPIRWMGSLHASPGAPPERIRQALDRIIELYEAWGKPDKAAEWRAKRSANEQNGGFSRGWEMH